MTTALPSVAVSSPSATAADIFRRGMRHADQISRSQPLGLRVAALEWRSMRSRLCGRRTFFQSPLSSSLEDRLA